MPISVAVPVRRITQDEFHAIDYRVMRAVFDVHNELGNLCDEHIYRDEIAERCRTDGFEQVHTEVAIRVSFEDYVKRYSIDLLVESSALYELKVADALAPAHRKQTLNYLLLTGLGHGKLVNMKPDSVDYEFVSTRLTPDRRYDFHINESRWRDADADGRWLRTLMKRLVSEWGVFLEVELFYDAVKYFRGGEDQVIRKIGLYHDGRPIGTQRGHLLNPSTAFKISAITGDTAIYEKHLRKFLRHTKLARIQWINFNHHNVEFITIDSNDFAHR
jgi:GxxExxY protein